MIEVNAAPLSRLERLAAIVTGKDDRLLAHCPNSERHDAVQDAFALLLLCLLEFALWLFVLTSFGMGILAVPAALLVALIIAQLDVRLTSSDNSPRGILRSQPFRRSTVGRFAIRFGLCLLLSIAPAFATDLALFRGEAIEAMEQERERHNRPVMDEYKQRIDALEQRRVGAVSEEIVNLTAQLRQSAQTQRQLDEAAGGNERQSLDAQGEVLRQIEGTGGRLRGPGPLAAEARITADIARRQAGQTRAQASALRTESDRLRAALVQAEARRQRQLQAFVPERARLEAERDGRLLNETSGPLTALMGIVRLHHDPDHNLAIWIITLIVVAASVTLEMSFFLRLVFKPASVHDALLNLDRQRRVAAAVNGFQENLDLQRRAAPLRIVSLDDDPPARGWA